MFKFLKSKKGFTLVELMIVVVIMAILVAVAVPIYSAVTKNARTKTCVANMREIVSQVNNAAMAEGKAVSGGFGVTSNGDKGTLTNNTLKFGDSEVDVEGLFQTLPYCPASGTYTVTTAAATTGDVDGGVVITIKCENNTDETTHEYGAAD